MFTSIVRMMIAQPQFPTNPWTQVSDRCNGTTSHDSQPKSMDLISAASTCSRTSNSFGPMKNGQVDGVSRAAAD